MDRRHLLTLTGSSALGAAAALAGCGGSSTPEHGSSVKGRSTATRSPVPTASPAPPSSPSAPSSPASTPSFDTPGGMTPLSSGARLVGWCGHPGAPGQGRLGVGNDLAARTTEMLALTRQYAGAKPVVPVMELIVTTVHATPGADGTYRTRIDGAVIDQWLAMARRRRALLLLNIQPGRARFIDEVRAYERWLEEPDVGVALDPEWSVQPGQVPGRVFGHTTGAELNLVGQYLSALVSRRGLPEKVAVFHQLNPGVVRQESTLRPYPGMAWVKSVDGIGSPGAKVATWKRVTATTPDFVRLGFKLFYQEDVKTGGRLMTPAEVLALDPVYVMYE
ncbi:hypothetical protein [Aestuariimicrobium sp. T2.26MG-19.2B]|uniref:hypothetical protein n=1 Tax=Aestuariimicrobium sp. T2.26MG-19.2B TaxID=3040679 RepID=UPI0024773537|nr:hypothetical protein [Aestuariimicrobium sp. T2.26MG-19.2B]CAI9411279.1 hypothetical protein AESSP_02616 [Aestuariimicrobium sp. T2.26MG-19.2B]